MNKDEASKALSYIDTGIRGGQEAHDVLEALINSHFDMVERNRAERRDLSIKTEVLRRIVRLIDEMGDEVAYSEHLKVIHNMAIGELKATEDL